MAGTMDTLRVGGVPGGYPSEIDSSVKVRFVEDSEIINLSDLSVDLLKLLGGVNQGQFDNEKLEWVEHDIWARRLTNSGTLDGTAGTDPLTVTAQAHRYPIGTLLRNISHADREIVRVEAHVDANDLTVRRGYAGTTVATWAATDIVIVCGFSMHEGDAASGLGSGDWVYRPTYITTLPFNYHQIQHVALRQTWHRAGNRLYGSQTGQADFAEQVTQTMAEQLVAVEAALIMGERYAGDATIGPSAAGGLEFYITAANNAQVSDLNGKSLTRKDIEDLMQNLAYSVGRQNMANLIVCDYWFGRKVTSFFDSKERLTPNDSIAGLEVDRVRIPGLGVVQILPHVACPDGRAYFIKVENIKVQTFAGLGQPHVGEIIQTSGPYQGRYFYMNWSASIKGVEGMGLIQEYSLTS